MRKPRPPLSPIFRSQLQGELLAAVLLTDRERSVSELAALLEASVATVQREVTRLEEGGVFTSRRIGATRLVSADRTSPIHEPLAELVLRTFGPAIVLARELAGIEGVERAEIFGSWAARYAGEPGPPPGDLDLLVVGTPDRDDVFEAARRAERMLGREVNAVFVSPDRWNARADPFLAEIISRPRITVLPSDEPEATDDELGTGPRDDHPAP